MNAKRAKMDASGMRLAIIVSRWNELITEALLRGALDEIETHGGTAEVYRVPGTWEIPLVAARLVSGPGRPNAIIALGCILQGETPHARLLSSDVSSALMRLQTEHGVPIAWGILTPETADQALDRAGLKHGNKGREAALAGIEMASLLAAMNAP